MKSAEWICTAEGLTVENMQQQWMTDTAQVSSPSLSTVGPVFGQWSKQNSARSVPILQNREPVQSAKTPKARETFLNISRPDTCSLSDNFWILMFKKSWSIIIKTDRHISHSYTCTQPAVSPDQNYSKFLTTFRIKEACYSRVSFEEVYIYCCLRKNAIPLVTEVASCLALTACDSCCQWADRQQQLWPVPCAQPLSSAAVSWPLFMWWAASSLLELLIIEILIIIPWQYKWLWEPGRDIWQQLIVTWG